MHTVILESSQDLAWRYGVFPGILDYPFAIYNIKEEKKLNGDLDI